MGLINHNDFQLLTISLEVNNFMASIVDSFSEALNEDFSYLKIIGFAVPVYFVAQLYLVGNMAQFSFWGSILGVLFLGLLTQGINNVRMSRREILSIQPVQVGRSLLKAFMVIVPQLAIFGFVGHFCISNFNVPIDLPHMTLIFSIIVWSIIFSIILTSYLSFAKYLKVEQGYNYLVIFESCIDVFVSVLFFIPQLLIANVVLIGPVWYLYSLFQIPFTNWGFVAYCSAAFVINISILANYLAQTAYEQIKGNNEEYDGDQIISVIDDAAERLNGK